MVVCKFFLLVFSGGDSLLFYSFIYLLFYLFIYLFIYFLIQLLFLLLLKYFFYTRLDWEYLCPELLGVLGQIDDGFNGFSQKS